ncbi:hypothetical protein M440DRAFT_1354944 [Trichoderma longibrachiatum ATCC 18648]|uniref:WW domain-containing protein n=1 Tax=Trichoderma longibrachiatum ATCC 18648 TaxID=983965 RepID=A0A2T4C5E2_TRILO|nr:hypothetical protein M440DRAFT_1354944 [Trichoderma longibrachiatum ATCC 18648]
MSYVDNLSGQFGELGLGGSQSHQPPPPSGEHGDYGYHSANRDDARPAQYYASSPQPTYQPPSDKPPLPQGWIPLFDQSRQRWYYANQETGVTQWEAPGYEERPHYVQQPVIVNEYNNDYNEYNENYSSGPPAVLPPTDEDGNSVSSSDRESVQEAREEYEEALADAQDSDASSSDYEELAEAREEYEEEYEETYED